MADIAHFKGYNDFYGHDRGDDVLVRVAGAIKGALQRPVDFCARYGGEEFIVVLPDTDEKGAIHVVKKILEQVRALNIRHERSMVAEFVTISLGIFSDTQTASDHETLIRNADTALYKAKSNGKNRFEVFGSVLDKPVV
jgi:diguanylate cyclase (GGDEF)-like protein